MTLTVHGIIKENQKITTLAPKRILFIPVSVCFMFQYDRFELRTQFCVEWMCQTATSATAIFLSFFEIFGWALLGILRLSLGTRWMMVNDLGRSPVYRLPQRCMLYRKLYAALHTYDTWYL